MLRRHETSSMVCRQLDCTSKFTPTGRFMAPKKLGSPLKCGSTSFCGHSTTSGRRINDDIVFEIELIKQVEINVDYILLLVQKYRDAKGDGTDKEVRAEIVRAVDASPSLRNKKDLIEDFVDSVSNSGRVDEEWRRFVAARAHGRAGPDHRIGRTQARGDAGVHRYGVPRRRDPDDWHGDH